MSVLAIDVGGTFIKGTLFGKEIRALEKIDTPRDTLNHFLQSFAPFFCGQHDLEAVAVSMPGVIDEETGFVTTGGSLKYIQNLNLAKQIRACCGDIPVQIVNDAKAGALAEIRSGALQNVQNGVMVTLGTAVGGAVILNRTVIKGKHHFAGEFSYLLLDEQNGNTIRNLGEAGGSSSTSVNYFKRTGKKCRPEDVFEAAKSDPAAVEAIREYCAMLAKPLMNMQCMVDPERIVIGGGISRQPLLIRLLQEETFELQNKTGFLDYGMPEVQIMPCRYADNTYGAYYAYLDRKNRGGTDVLC